MSKIPPKSKLYNKTGKHKTINSSNIPSSSNSVASTSSNSEISEMDTDATRQLELELCWCVQTLEVSLQSGKLNEKQGKIFINKRCALKLFNG